MDGKLASTARAAGCRSRFTSLETDGRTMEEEVLSGLKGSPKRIAPKFLYDAEGSRLFDRICELPWYYLTRAEASILERHAGAMLDRMGRDLCIIEIGAGGCSKGRILLAAGGASAFVPVDIAAGYLQDAAEGVAGEFTGVEVHAVAMDFLGGLERIGPILPPAEKRLIFFAGSSIGNFDPPDACRLLRQFHALLSEGDFLLVGYDLQKDDRVLTAAYDDPEGVTASFNLNLLARFNRELSADFDLGKFRHVALYNGREGRVEMHLESLEPQVVRIADEPVFFGRSERTHTESSYKYTVDGFSALAEAAGFHGLDVWKDGASYFAVGLYVKDGAAAGRKAPF